MPAIVQKGDPVLRATAKEIPPADIASAHTKKVLRDMGLALAGEKDGVALAAPQIGHSLRIFIVSGKVFVKEKHETPGEKRAKKTPPPPDKVFINPRIQKLSKKTKMLDEGCLSVRFLYGKIKRSEKATVTAYDETGKKFSYSGTGLMAQIFQHETDHLNGILFIDTAKDVEELTPEKRAARRKKLKGE